MDYEDLYRTSGLGEVTDPVDVASAGEPAVDADSIVYRLGFTAGWVGEMPGDVEIVGVRIYQTTGPAMTQQTDMRQRPGPDLVWDKRMRRRVEVGADHWLTICELRRPLPNDVAAAMNVWRDTALGALGAVAAVLDERLALEQVLEDVLYVSDGVAVAAGDLRASVRPHRPYHVTDMERAALRQLAQPEALDSRLASAARWYLRAARQGPGPDGVVFMWIALESLSASQSTSPKAIESELVQLGWDLESLPISVGRLAGLRADIVHSGLEQAGRVYEGFYVLEAMARALLRARLGVLSTWPAQVGANIFDSPWNEEIDRSWAQPEVHWHDTALPALEADPRLPDLSWGSELAPPEDVNTAPAVEVVGTHDAIWQRRLVHWVQSAARALQVPDDPIRIEVSEALHGEIAVNEERIAVNPRLLREPQPLKELRLAWLVHGAVAQHHLMARGVPSDGGLGSLLLELAGEWSRYREFVQAPDAPLDDKELTVNEPRGDDFFTLGGHIGAAAAGSSRSATALERWRVSREPSDGLVELVNGLMVGFAQHESPADLLDEVALVFESSAKP